MINLFQDYVKPDTFQRLTEVENVFTQINLTSHQGELDTILVRFEKTQIELREVEELVEEVYEEIIDKLLYDAGIIFNEETLVPFAFKCKLFLAVYNSVQEDNLDVILEILIDTKTHDEDDYVEEECLYDLVSEFSDITKAEIYQNVLEFDFDKLISILDVLMDAHRELDYDEEEEFEYVNKELIETKRSLFKLNPGFKLGKELFIANDGKHQNHMKLVIQHYDELSVYLDEGNANKFTTELVGLIVNSLESEFAEELYELFEEVLEYLTMDINDKIHIKKAYNTIKLP